VLSEVSTGAVGTSGSGAADAAAGAIDELMERDRV
jgi:hypothetical protein